MFLTRFMRCYHSRVNQGIFQQIYTYPILTATQTREKCSRFLVGYPSVCKVGLINLLAFMVFIPACGCVLWIGSGQETRKVTPHMFGRKVNFIMKT